MVPIPWNWRYIKRPTLELYNYIILAESETCNNVAVIILFYRLCLFNLCSATTSTQNPTATGYIEGANVKNISQWSLEYSKLPLNPHSPAPDPSSHHCSPLQSPHHSPSPHHLTTLLTSPWSHLTPPIPSQLKNQNSPLPLAPLLLTPRLF